jgi:glycosyltransferase involved in cell wall biosynthesis
MQSMPTAQRAMRVLWISDFPIEWLPDAPAEATTLPRQHALSWQRVLFEQFVQNGGIDLHVAVLRKSIRSHTQFTLRGATFYLRRMPGWLRAPTFFWPDTFALRKIVQEIRPDVIHAWGSEKGAALVAGRLGCPYLVTVQGLMQWYRELVPINRYERFAAFLEKRSLPHAPLVSTETPTAVRYLSERHTHATQIEHAPDPMFTRIVRRPCISPARLLFVGSFCYRKGGDLVLKALERLQSEAFEFVVVGSIDSELKSRWDALAAGPLAGRLVLKSSLTAEQVAAELARATMEIFPTRADTSPNAVKEAAVAGVPVVGTRVGGIPDYIHQGRNGLLVESNDAVALTQAIETALRHPLFSRGEVEANALTEARAYLAPELMREKFIAAYRHVVNSAGM